MLLLGKRRWDLISLGCSCWDKGGGTLLQEGALVGIKEAGPYFNRVLLLGKRRWDLITIGCSCWVEGGRNLLQ